MDGAIAEHLARTPLTTVALFSVTNTARGAISTKQNGYRGITGSVGRQVVREAHARGVRVDLVFSSFGNDRNRRFLGAADLQDATIASLVRLVGDLDLDGVNVDIESLDTAFVADYGAFVGRLRAAVVEADSADRVTVATGANVTGSLMAAAAAGAGADRILLMGYDYHWSGSDPGASAPLARRDGSEKNLSWSLDLYASLGVPPERTLLGLPLYGMTWPVAGPELGAPRMGPGKAWIPRRNLELLRDPAIVPLRDEAEVVEFYAFADDGAAAPPTPGDPRGLGDSDAPGRSDASGRSGSVPTAGTSAARPTPDTRRWRAVYVDSPATLAPKLALADERGLAGAGFWAIGYERGLPGYTDLIARYAAGKPME